jgi:2-succinyl-5-enolpyruvyl-6-hydroxy-3-cyclohexene-1-carboxylate synthase
VGDPFQTNPLSWIGFEADLLETLNIAINQDTAWREDNGQFRNQWIQFIQEQPLTIQQLEEPFSKELRWTNAFISHLTGEKHILHMGNSMPIRYASWSATCQASLYANRGVSGIDGSISTAVGSAIANPDKQIYAVVGDVSSIYDSNAFWSDIPKNLTVIIINNQGGRIFDWIAGPNQFPALRPFIHTPKNVDFSHLASFFQIPYCQLSLLEDQSSVKAALEFPGGIIELI